MRLSVPSRSEKDNPVGLLFSYIYLHFVFEQVNKGVKKREQSRTFRRSIYCTHAAASLIKNYQVTSRVRAFEMRKNNVRKNHVGKGGWHCFRPVQRRLKDQCRTV
jgi:hypothetical protein